MLKNDFRYIIRRVIVALLLAFIFFFLKSNNVLAANVSISNADFQYSTHLCNLLEVGCDNFYVSGYSSNGTWKNLTSQPSGGLGGILQQYFYVNSYARAYANMTTSNTYVFTFRQQFDPKNKSILQSIDTWTYDIYGYNSGGSTPLSDSYFASQNCSTRNVPTHNYAVETTCSFTLNTNISYVLVRTAFKLTPTGTRFTISNAQLQSSQSEIGALQEQTNVIKQEQQKLRALMSELFGKYFGDDDEDENAPANIDTSQMSELTGIFPAGPIDGLLAIPLNLITILSNNTSGSCTPLSFTFVWDMPITLPCIGSLFWSQLNSTLLLFLSDVPAVYLFVLWSKSIYKRFERAVSFESSTDDEWGGV